jgi:AcrR family transcriptional regulator
MARKTRVTPRKEPRQDRSKRLVDALLAATSRVLVKEGYAATSTTRVAEVAGVSIGSLYQYFPSKEALVAALVDDHIAKILAIMGDATLVLHEAPLENAVRSFVKTVLLAHAVNPELHAVLTQNFSKIEGFEKVRGLNLQARQLLAAYLGYRRGSVRPKNLELASFILVHSVQAVVSAAVVEPSLRVDDEELVDELTMLVLSFLKNPSM